MPRLLAGDPAQCFWQDDATLQLWYVQIDSIVLTSRSHDAAKVCTGHMLLSNAQLIYAKATLPVAVVCNQLLRRVIRFAAALLLGAQKNAQPNVTVRF